MGPQRWETEGAVVPSPTWPSLAMASWPLPPAPIFVSDFPGLLPPRIPWCICQGLTVSGTATLVSATGAGVRARFCVRQGGQQLDDQVGTAVPGPVMEWSHTRVFGLDGVPFASCPGLQVCQEGLWHFFLLLLLYVRFPLSLLLTVSAPSHLIPFHKALFRASSVSSAGDIENSFKAFPYPKELGGGLFS